VPPTKILVAARLDEFEIITIAHRRAINLKVLEKNFMRRLLVVPRERTTRIWRVTLVPQLKQSTFNLCHAGYRFD
jgi:hypothetical protein